MAECNLTQTDETSDLPHVKISFQKQRQNQETFALIDSGSTTSFIKQSAFDKLFPADQVTVNYQPT